MQKPPAEQGAFAGSRQDSAVIRTVGSDGVKGLFLRGAVLDEVA